MWIELSDRQSTSVNVDQLVTVRRYVVVQRYYTTTWYNRRTPWEVLIGAPDNSHSVKTYEERCSEVFISGGGQDGITLRYDDQKVAEADLNAILAATGDEAGLIEETRYRDRSSHYG